MKDSIIKGTGDSRYLKSVSDFLTRYPSYADFAAALIAGTLPVDLNGVNTAGFQQLGTQLNKANLLSDATAAKFAAETPDTVNAALGLLAESNRDLILSLCKRRCVKVITASPDGTPVAGIKITGISPIIGSEAVTDKNGIVFGYATSDTTTVTSDTSSYIDLTSSSSTASTPKDSFTAIRLTISPINYLKVTTSRSVQFSPLLKKLNVTLVGGGGGGGGGNTAFGGYGGKGGGGGYVTTQTAVNFSANTIYTLVVGAGGVGERIYNDSASGGSGGGTSTFLGFSALGGNTGGMGSDGHGNGNGGDCSLPSNPIGHDGSQGSNGFGGGGGGGGYADNNHTTASGGSGGSPAGGHGGNASYPSTCYSGSNGTDGYGGGGGGGGQVPNANGGQGGTGGSGCVILEMEH